MATATKTKPKQDDKLDLRILRLVADGHRTAGELKKKLKKDVRGRITALRKDNSLEAVEGELVLTKRGAGRLRFPS